MWRSSSDLDQADSPLQAFLKTTSNTNSPGPGGQLVRVLAWERLDEDDDEL